MHSHHLTMGTRASPMSEYLPMFGVQVGYALFHGIFGGEPVAENGLVQIDDHKPDLGLAIKSELLNPFNITE